MSHVNNSKIGSGFILTYNAIVIDQVESIDFSGLSVEALESTNLASVFHEYRPGLPNPGTFTAEIYLDDLDTKHQGLISSSLAPAVEAYTLTFPVATGASVPSTITGNAFITNFKINSVTADQLIKCSIELQCTGILTFTGGS